MSIRLVHSAPIATAIAVGRLLTARVRKVRPTMPVAIRKPV
jgi:hypothetical protein